MYRSRDRMRQHPSRNRYQPEALPIIGLQTDVLCGCTQYAGCASVLRATRGAQSQELLSLREREQVN